MNGEGAEAVASQDSGTSSQADHAVSAVRSQCLVLGFRSLGLTSVVEAQRQGGMCEKSSLVLGGSCVRLRVDHDRIFEETRGFAFAGRIGG